MTSPAVTPFALASTGGSPCIPRDSVLRAPLASLFLYRSVERFA